MDTLTLPLALLVGLLAVALALVFLAFRVSRVLSITVQAPVAQLPDSVLSTLEAVNAKLTPALAPIDDTKLASLVYEAVAMAEQSKNKGRDRFLIARDYVVQRAEAQRLQVDLRDLALRIEAAVALNKKRP